MAGSSPGSGLRRGAQPPAGSGAQGGPRPCSARRRSTASFSVAVAAGWLCDLPAAPTPGSRAARLMPAAGSRREIVVGLLLGGGGGHRRTRAARPRPRHQFRRAVAIRLAARGRPAGSADAVAGLRARAAVRPALLELQPARRLAGAAGGGGSRRAASPSPPSSGRARRWRSRPGWSEPRDSPPSATSSTSACCGMTGIGGCCSRPLSGSEAGCLRSRRRAEDHRAGAMDARRRSASSSPACRRRRLCQLDGSRAAVLERCADRGGNPPPGRDELPSWATASRRRLPSRSPSGRPLFAPSRGLFTTHPDWGPEQRDLSPHELRCAPRAPSPRASLATSAW